MTVHDATEQAYLNGYKAGFQDGKAGNESVELNMYDKEELIENCTVQILTNTMTGKISVGWWRGTIEDRPC